MLGVYVHIPFCKSICTYCDFCKMLYNSKYVFRYLEQLECEIDKRYSNEIIDTIYRAERRILTASLFCFALLNN